MASYLNCVTTIGICVFRRVNLDWRAFLIGIYVNSFILFKKKGENLIWTTRNYI